MNPNVKATAKYIPGTTAWTMVVFEAVDVPEGTQVQPVQQPASVEGQDSFHHYGLSSEQLQQLLNSGLKPEEISGAEDTQHDRVHELLHWFFRLTQGNGNSKWAVHHACELAYFIATNGINKDINLEAIRDAAFLEGVNITPKERNALERTGFVISRATPVPAAIVQSEIELGLAQRDAETHGMGYMVEGKRVAPEWVTVVHGSHQPDTPQGNWPHDFQQVIEGAEKTAHELGHAAGIEEAAKICESQVFSDGDTRAKAVAKDCAAAIRTLNEKGGAA